MEKALPIGSVVKLVDSDKLMMVCGFCPTSPENPGYVYDYSGFPYPEGYMEAKKIYMFDETQIEGLIALGYQDREVFHYLASLEEKADEIKEKIKTAYEESGENN